MKHYVLGFVFNKNQDKVLLIQKKRPSWQAGRWNGIGGKIKDVDKSPLEAMQRECREETNWNYDWEHCITFVCSGGTVFVYKAISDYKALEKGGENIIFDQVEDEVLEVWRLDNLPDKRDKELNWILPVLLSDIQFPICVNLRDVEQHTEKSNQNSEIKITKEIVIANNDKEAIELHQADYEPLCPECGRRAFATNFEPEHLGGKKNDKRIVWFCSDMGHCAFSIDKNIKWQKKSNG